MRFESLRVKDFGCVRSAHLRFGQGLTVVYGPNDLGKSTLALAIRAALLLPHSSSKSRVFQPWDRDAIPRVELVFRGDDDRYYKVKKTWGSGTRGTSILESSSDGATYTVEARSRQVDGKLRTMLGWGIATPGGKGAPTGLPESFLTKVLLGGQADVAKILQETVESDSAGDARERLVTALGAYAMDPLFKEVLERAQAKVDEAFTPAGKPRRSKHSPFKVAAVDLQLRREELESARREADDAAAVLEAGGELEQARVKAEAARDAARLRLAKIEARFAEGATQREVRARRERAAKALRDHDAKREALARERALVEERRADCEAAERARDIAEKVRRDAEAARESARDAHHRASAGDAEQTRRLQIAEAEKALAVLEQMREIEARLSEAEASLAEAERRRKASGAALEAAKHAAQEVRSELGVLEHARALLDLREIEARLDRAARVEANRKEKAAEAKKLRAAATRAEKELPEAPEAGVLEALRALHRKKELAMARLDVGLSVAITRQPAVDVRAHIDEAEVDTPEGRVLDFEARREVRLAVALPTGEPMVELRVVGGGPDARAKAESCREQWAEEAEAVLEAYGVADLDALAARVEERRAAEAEVASLRERGDRLAEEADSLAVDDVEGLEARRDRLREGLEALDADVRAAAERVEDAAVLHDEREGRTLALEEAEEKLAAAQKEDAEARADARSARTQAKAAREAREALVESAGRIPEDLEERAEEAAQRLASLRAEASSEGAEEELARTAKAAEAAGRALAEARRVAEEARSVLVAAETREAVLGEQLEKEDREALEGALREAEEALGGGDEEGVEESQVEEAHAALDEAEADLRAAVSRVDQHAGALRQVGGHVAIERRNEAEEALELAERHQRDVEVEFGAWRLLRDALREAENAEGAHLGQALAAPVGERFDALLEAADASGRYPRPRFDASLQAEGLEIGGELRTAGALSVGTQEQLATVLRVSVAEALGAPLVLDDHLTQTDAERVAWFRELLRTAADQIQVVVLTCHPLDYVEASHLPGPEDEPTRDRAAGLLRVIDAARIVERT